MGEREDQAHRSLGFLSLFIEHSLGLREGECDSYFVSSLSLSFFLLFQVDTVTSGLSLFFCFVLV